MPRRARVFVEGALYHVYNRVARGAEVFREGDEADRFLELIRTVRDRDGWTVYAWCVMSNSSHLAVRTGPVPLARSMAYVQSRFGASSNRRRRSSGPLWQSRYAEGRTSGLERPDVEPSRFIELACRALGAAPGDIRAPGQGAAASRLRSLVAALAIERWRIRSGHLSELVGRRPEVVSR
jgi:REP element-mobilizing transposase RayT